jgi:hypothetical protein
LDVTNGCHFISAKGFSSFFMANFFPNLLTLFGLYCYFILQCESVTLHKDVTGTNMWFWDFLFNAFVLKNNIINVRPTYKVLQNAVFHVLCGPRP